MKVAAVQMTARLGDIEHNTTRAKQLIAEACEQGCGMVILPEFFPSAVAFHPSMKEAARPLDGPVLELMQEAARRFGAYVGGSFIASRNGDEYNTFVLAFPDGRYATHDKDQPTMWENCWYRGADDEGILDTPLGPVGAALCWELIRSRTARRLRGRVDLLVGGSCWWTVPGRAIPIPGKMNTHRRNREIMRDTPSRIARMLGVPFIHAAHAGSFTSRMPLVPGLPYRSCFLGETQVVDAAGEVLARLPREKGEGICTAEIAPGRAAPSEEIPERFWIPELPPLFKAAWAYQNIHGGIYYRRRHPKRG